MFTSQSVSALLADHGHRTGKRSRARAAIPPAGREDRVRGQGRGGQRRDGGPDPVGGRRGRGVSGRHHGQATADGDARGGQTPNGPRGHVGQQRGRGGEHVVRGPGGRRRRRRNSQHQSARSDPGTVYGRVPLLIIDVILTRILYDNSTYGCGFFFLF